MQRQPCVSYSVLTSITPISTPLVASTPGLNQATSLPIKRLTPSVMVPRHKKGLCFNCDTKFVPDHCCNPPQFLCLILDTDNGNTSSQPLSVDQDVSDTILLMQDLATDSSPCIFFYAFFGQIIPSALKIVRAINGHNVVVFINNNSIKISSKVH